MCLLDFYRIGKNSVITLKIMRFPKASCQRKMCFLRRRYTTEIKKPQLDRNHVCYRTWWPPRRTPPPAAMWWTSPRCCTTISSSICRMIATVTVITKRVAQSLSFFFNPFKSIEFARFFMGNNYQTWIYRIKAFSWHFSVFSLTFSRRPFSPYHSYPLL